MARVEQAIDRHALLQTGERVLVAVSGGLDSMVLLQVLHRLAQSRSWRLVVAHFDHQLRGPDSRADARFVARAARALQLDFVQECGEVLAFARETRSSAEMAARILRHRFLARAARATQAPTVALAHHADDQVELFFLRLFRGAGGEGLAGMSWTTVSPEDSGIRLIRPLLDERRMDILEFARTERIRFREDASNRSLDIVRNRVRHALLPELRRRYQPALDSVILRTMTTLRDTATWVGDAAEEWRRARRKVSFARLPVALQRQILCLELRRLEVPVAFDLVEWLRLHEGERISIESGRFLHRNQGARIVESTDIEFCQQEARVMLEGRGGEHSFGDVHFEWRFVALRAHTRQPAKRRGQVEIFDAAKVGPNVLLRHWRPGDRFQPSGLSRPTKLQDLFVNRHIPRTTRHRLVVAATVTGEIFWVEGLRIAEGFKLDKTSRRGLKWSWRRTEPGGKGRLRPA